MSFNENVKFGHPVCLDVMATSEKVLLALALAVSEKRIRWNLTYMSENIGMNSAGRIIISVIEDGWFPLVFSKCRFLCAEGQT